MLSFLFRAGGWLLVAAIVVLSLIPAQDRPHSGAPGHFEHLFAYMAASALLAVGYPTRRARLILFGFFVVLSGMLEIMQLWVPGRSSELTGFLGSSIGATLGVVAATVIRSADKLNKSELPRT